MLRRPARTAATAATAALIMTTGCSTSDDKPVAQPSVAPDRVAEPALEVEEWSGSDFLEEERTERMAADFDLGERLGLDPAISLNLVLMCGQLPIGEGGTNREAVWGRAVVMASGIPTAEQIRQIEELGIKSVKVVNSDDESVLQGDKVRPPQPEQKEGWIEQYSDLHFVRPGLTIRPVAVIVEFNNGQIAKTPPASITLVAENDATIAPKQVAKLSTPAPEITSDPSAPTYSAAPRTSRSFGISF